IQQAYSLRPYLLLGKGAPRLAKSVNTGIVIAPSSFLDLERVERFLRLPRLRPAVWIEQTAWAMLAADRCDVLDSRQFAIPHRRLVLASNPIALHFVSSVRSGLASALWESEGKESSEEVQVRMAPTGICSAWTLALAMARRRIARLWDR